jgi:hypothetical protein
VAVGGDKALLTLNSRYHRLEHAIRYVNNLLSRFHADRLAAYLRRIRDVARAGSRYTAYSQSFVPIKINTKLTYQQVISERLSVLSFHHGLVRPSIDDSRSYTDSPQ